MARRLATGGCSVVKQARQRREPDKGGRQGHRQAEGHRQAGRMPRIGPRRAREGREPQD
jgi:hypothetical protein